jgi:hypothetical protein
MMTDDPPIEYRLPIPSETNDLAYIALKTLKQLTGRELHKFEAMTGREVVVRPTAKVMRAMLLQIGLQYVIAIESVERNRKKDAERCNLSLQNPSDEKPADIAENP